MGLMSRAAKDISEAPRERPWQIMFTGPSLDQIDAATRQALERILELFTGSEIFTLCIETLQNHL